MREVHIDHIVERRSAVRFAPDFARDHLSRHRLAMMLRKKCEQIELARCQRDLTRPARDTTCLHIEREITDLLSQGVSGIDPPQQSTNPRARALAVLASSSISKALTPVTVKLPPCRAKDGDSEENFRSARPAAFVTWAQHDGAVCEKDMPESGRFLNAWRSS